MKAVLGDGSQASRNKKSEKRCGAGTRIQKCLKVGIVDHGRTYAPTI